MTDVHDRKTRSYNMSQIKGINTRPELLVRKYLFSKGFRYRLYDKKLPGKPDIVLPKYKTIVFVHGCFWHGHKDCKYFIIPQTRTRWWTEKISRTRQNDSDNELKLTSKGWNVITIYECELKNKDVENRLSNLITQISPRLQLKSNIL
jgi:DNA mismatch endonuclease, patch repair protein